MFFVSRIDAESQWIESYDLFPKVKQTLDPNPEDPASFSDLLGGIDTLAFNLTKDDGRQSRVRGFDKLTGFTVKVTAQAKVAEGDTPPPPRTYLPPFINAAYPDAR